MGLLEDADHVVEGLVNLEGVAFASLDHLVGLFEAFDEQCAVLVLEALFGCVGVGRLKQ